MWEGGSACPFANPSPDPRPSISPVRGSTRHMRSCPPCGPPSVTPDVSTTGSLHTGTKHAGPTSRQPPTRRCKLRGLIGTTPLLASLPSSATRFCVPWVFGPLCDPSRWGRCRTSGPSTWSVCPPQCALTVRTTMASPNRPSFPRPLPVPHAGVAGRSCTSAWT